MDLDARCQVRPLTRIHNGSSERCTRLGAVTLVELMIVVVVLGIVAAIAAPMLTATDATKVNSAAKLLIADLQFAQAHSISHADDLCGLRVEAGGVGYSITTNGPPPFDCASASAASDIIHDTTLAMTFGSGRAAELSGVSISGYALDGDACVVYDALGALDQATDATITLTAGGSTVTVTVDPISGEATIAP
jgi:prepilin-type N-terminal cleavage/methylation domain-containing protein